MQLSLMIFGMLSSTFKTMPLKTVFHNQWDLEAVVQTLLIFYHKMSFNAEDCRMSGLQTLGLSFCLKMCGCDALLILKCNGFCIYISMKQIIGITNIYDISFNSYHVLCSNVHVVIVTAVNAKVGVNLTSNFLFHQFHAAF